ncbi:HD-GYP domain-containing protein [Paenibacillus sp. MZ04-78.2]|uniref:HD-GYP domain-containing protein n=1 Tax=Paenibacillus sp. MZ04-78.2 TaxID=2962034 RepID=UPI0020B74F4E|nr:HD-GYP domain-containing protein [Paenibacillus sp. MZ04-78.2]MCP3772263.1 HD-GYP domain-containing protein [Paenibacillus sp. MZ04-78.2]
MLISIHQVKVGDRLGSDTFNGYGLLVLSAHTELSVDDIEKLKLHKIDEVDIAFPDDPEPDAAIDESPPARTMHAASAAAVTAYHEAVDGMKNIFEQAIQKGIVYKDQIDNGFNPLVQQVHQVRDVVSLLLVLNNTDDYTYQHSVQVGMISYYIAKWLGQSESDAILVGKAGYLHDIGKSLIDPAILRKPEKLTAEEYERMKKHTVYGYELLQRSGLPAEVCLAALQHHERLDGSGYPYGLGGEEIHPLSKIVAVADIYSAMISSRVYQKKRDLLFVLRELHQCSFGQIDPQITQLFIQHMVPNFIGKKVQLASGETGTIILTHPTDVFRPLVNFDGTFIDLSERTDLEVEHIFAD